MPPEVQNEYDVTKDKLVEMLKYVETYGMGKMESKYGYGVLGGTLYRFRKKHGKELTEKLSLDVGLIKQ